MKYKNVPDSPSHFLMCYKVLIWSWLKWNLFFLFLMSPTWTKSNNRSEKKLCWRSKWPKIGTKAIRNGTLFFTSLANSKLEKSLAKSDDIIERCRMSSNMQHWLYAAIIYNTLASFSTLCLGIVSSFRHFIHNKMKRRKSVTTTQNVDSHKSFWLKRILK